MADDIAERLQRLRRQTLDKENTMSMIISISLMDAILKLKDRYTLHDMHFNSPKENVLFNECVQFIASKIQISDPAWHDYKVAYRAVRGMYLVDGNEQKNPGNTHANNVLKDQEHIPQKWHMGFRNLVALFWEATKHPDDLQKGVTIEDARDALIHAIANGLRGNNRNSDDGQDDQKLTDYPVCSRGYLNQFAEQFKSIHIDTRDIIIDLADGINGLIKSLLLRKLLQENISPELKLQIAHQWNGTSSYTYNLTEEGKGSYEQFKQKIIAKFRNEIEVLVQQEFTDYGQETQKFILSAIMRKIDEDSVSLGGFENYIELINFDIDILQAKLIPIVPIKPQSTVIIAAAAAPSSTIEDDFLLAMRLQAEEEALWPATTALTLPGKEELTAQLQAEEDIRLAYELQKQEFKVGGETKASAPSTAAEAAPSASLDRAPAPPWEDMTAEEHTTTYIPPFDYDNPQPAPAPESISDEGEKADKEVRQREVERARIAKEIADREAREKAEAQARAEAERVRLAKVEAHRGAEEQQRQEAIHRQQEAEAQRIREQQAAAERERARVAAEQQQHAAADAAEARRKAGAQQTQTNTISLASSIIFRTLRK